MHIVYLLRSKQNPDRVYIGLCGNMKNRLVEHNAGECKTTFQVFSFLSGSKTISIESWPHCMLKVFLSVIVGECPVLPSPQTKSHSRIYQILLHLKRSSPMTGVFVPRLSYLVHLQFLLRKEQSLPECPICYCRDSERICLGSKEWIPSIS